MVLPSKKLTQEQKEYQKLVKSKSPRIPFLRNFIRAYMVGGGICVIGQIIMNYFMSHGLSQQEAVAPTLASMIFLGALFTGLKVYDELGEFAGAGAAVPITGFSNTVVSAAMDFRREGLILGLGSKMFIIAGPVLVYGILAGFVVALIKVFILG
jgi:stage V sporulation protein AC